MNSQKLELKIEAGKFYRRRDGEKDGPDVVWPEHCIGLTYPAQRCGGPCWTRDGRANINADHPADLLSPWTEPEPPRLRAWKAEEVPVGAMCRVIGTADRFLITMQSGRHLRTSCGGFEHEPYAIVGVWEHSTDHGATWLPCGVMEVSK